MEYFLNVSITENAETSTKMLETCLDEHYQKDSKIDKMCVFCSHKVCTQQEGIRDIHPVLVTYM